jgi:hypothetical protein
MSSPYLLGLLELRHRLADDQMSANLAKIKAVHAACLRGSDVHLRESALDKQETSDPARSEASTNARTLQEVERGRYEQSA